MAAADIDAYFEGIDEPGRSTLEEMRRRILLVVPDAQQVISYAVPGFKVEGRTVAGLAAFKNHLSYLPHSGSVLAELADQLGGYTMTKSALHFPHDQPLPTALVRQLLEVRLGQAGLASSLS